MVEHAENTIIKPGQLYVIFGSLCPEWNEEDMLWRLQLPKNGPASGCIQVLGHRLPVNKFKVADLSGGYTGGWHAEVKHVPDCAVAFNVDHDSDAMATNAMKSFSGYVSVLDCKFHPLPPPTSGMTWPQWLQSFNLEVPEDLWATIDGRHVARDYILSDDPVLLRLRLRLRGGGKPTTRSDGLVKKLAAHLHEKGVPGEVATERATKIIEVVGHPAVEAAYASLDPWKALKGAAGNRVRMVLPQELKQARTTSKQVKEDPWIHGDPWSTSTASSSSKSETGVTAASPLTVTLVPGHFQDVDGESLPILQHLTAEAKGVAMVDQEEIESMAAVESLLSEDELGAVMVGTVQPAVGSLSCRQITFPALTENNKVLLRGFLIDFGSRQVVVAAPKHSINIQVNDVAILSVELRKEYVQDWTQAAKNPMKYVWAAIDGLQKATVASWSRKFFQGRRESSPEHATSWHAFIKIHAANLEIFLAMSGKAGIFFTPKDADSGVPSGNYRVVWLDHTDLDKASKILRLHQEFLGVVRGKQSLGLRTRAGDYSLLRKKLDPNWAPDGILTDIVVSRRWLVTPLPNETDKALVQQILSKLNWKAVPLKQVAMSTWLVGSGPSDPPPTDTFEFANQPVLITEQAQKRPTGKQEVVVAASSSFRKHFQERVARKLPVQTAVPFSAQDATMGGNAVMRTPTTNFFSDLKEEINGRLQDLQSQMQSAVNTVNRRVEEVESQAAATSMELQSNFLQHEHRLQGIESSMQSLSSTMVTKLDLQESLRQAMEAQTKDIRLMLACPKRSPDASPNHESKASRLA